MRTIKQILMQRDGLDEATADELIDDAREELQELLDNDDQEAAHDICQTHFGLEPDYLMELIPI